MKRLHLLILLTLILPVTALVGAAPAEPSSQDKVVLAYFAGWSDLPVARIPADKLTHLCYAFALIEDGVIHVGPQGAPPATQPADLPPQLREQFQQLQLLKQKHPQLRTLISVGGWGGSSPFSDTALTDSSRQKFARSCVSFIKRFGFDGVDIDWEYPVGGGLDPKIGRPEDKRNYTLLMQEIRRQLDELGQADRRHYLLTTATPGPPEHLPKMELDQVQKSVDFINLMTYDLAGAWSPLSSFNAPLYSPGEEQKVCVDSVVRSYLAAGVPADKIVLGVPFYGKAFGGVGSTNHGLFQPHDRKTHRPSGGGEFTYRTLKQRYIGKDPSIQRFWNDVAKVPWLYDSNQHLMITYDDPESVQLKAIYARQHQLRGVMFWELSQDDASWSLLDALLQIGPPQSPSDAPDR